MAKDGYLVFQYYSDNIILGPFRRYVLQDGKWFQQDSCGLIHGPSAVLMMTHSFRHPPPDMMPRSGKVVEVTHDPPKK
jgi:hypothetical protein